MLFSIGWVPYENKTTPSRNRGTRWIYDVGPNVQGRAVWRGKDWGVAWSSGYVAIEGIRI
jgi:hypothetical protein